MKIHTLVLALIISMFSTLYAKPMHDETTTFKVYGNCGMCKKRIEGALKKPGIKSASWDVDSKMITVTFDPHSMNANDVQKIVAEAGHDTEKVKASDKTYDALMGCCKYERAK